MYNLFNTSELLLHMFAPVDRDVMGFGTAEKVAALHD
jgi:hypothetical protein